MLIWSSTFALLLSKDVEDEGRDWRANAGAPAQAFK